MNISGVGNGSPINRSSAPLGRAGSSQATERLPLTDRLELSGVSKFMEALRANGIRADKVAAIKAEIEAGTYEDDAKINTTVDRLLADLESA
jgi:anti-sigma28 factor (negative regulator of flagellin synthesis)